MVAATVMSLIFTPVFYLVMQRLSEFLRRGRAKGQSTSPAE